MILRRFMKHVTEQNWFAVGLDVIVVITGIFLGMQVSEWNESYSNIKQEQVYLKLLIRDLEQLEDALDEKVGWEEKKIIIGDKLYSILEKDDYSEDRHQIGTYLIALSDRRTLSVESAAYTDMKSTGNLSLIKDTLLRNNIIAFFTDAQRAQLIMDKNSKHYIDEGFIPFVRSIGISYRQTSGILAPELHTIIDRRNAEGLDGTFSSNIMKQDDAVLKLSEQSPIWQQIKQQISWRVMIAVNDKASATILLSDTKLLKAKITAHLNDAQ